MAGCQSEFSDWQEELRYLNALANPTPAQFKRREELGGRAMEDWNGKRSLAMDAYKKAEETPDCDAVYAYLLERNDRLPSGERQTSDWLMQIARRKVELVRDREEQQKLEEEENRKHRELAAAEEKRWADEARAANEKRAAEEKQAAELAARVAEEEKRNAEWVRKKAEEEKKLDELSRRSTKESQRKAVQRKRGIH